MAEMIDLKELEEKVILVAVSTGSEDDAEASLDELGELASTAGARTVGRVIQNRENVHPGTYLGKGKIDEVREMLWDLQATGVICDDELSPAQLRNLEDALDTKVMDRTMVILDIFASRANTREGKIQVELAQLKYRAVRLVGMRNSLSRLGGGIGTRGPGEKKLETDRRLIHQRIGQLKGELEDVKRHREVTRQQRGKNFSLTAAIVGYTNAGKSTLLNRLTNAGILAEDKLFATLDPTTRSFTMEDGQQVLLTDTVGFIRKLPHHLIEAFKSTLEEARYSDIIFHVVDCSNPQMDMQMHVVKETLRELEIVDKTVVTVFNKMDRLRELQEDGKERQIPRDFSSDYQVRISARTGEGLKDLEEVLKTIIRSRRVYLEKVYPYSQTGRIQSIRKYGQLLSEEYREDGVAVKAYVPAELFAGLYKD
ncbi:GTPase HflX [Lacrimispora sp. 210928-DFI.3.58]|uniref:GTPase HflX n=1 Tax=Lacrimispora sp. 210928-DFI.3.58 TaxID=2883214 RepID=UPI0015B4E770|nr:GTPase HflX [Lacrimispora sp. 210928-DFI.3.58]MCB7318444.1 GTPase HflX [Lacrimispora sp. 210928-DFI.3.58]